MTDEEVAEIRERADLRPVSQGTADQSQHDVRDLLDAYDERDREIERLEAARVWMERNSVLRAPNEQTIADYLAELGEAETLSGGDQAYDPPEDGWVCFHCGTRFWTERAAREHFGERPSKFRITELEAQLARYQSFMHGEPAA